MCESENFTFGKSETDKHWRTKKIPGLLLPLNIWFKKGLNNLPVERRRMEALLELFFVRFFARLPGLDSTADFHDTSFYNSSFITTAADFQLYWENDEQIKEHKVEETITIIINKLMPVRQNSFTHLRVLLEYWYSLAAALFWHIRISVVDGWICPSLGRPFRDRLTGVSAGRRRVMGRLDPQAPYGI